MLIVDDREGRSPTLRLIQDLVGADGCRVEHLPIGDLLDETKGVVIERKTIADFCGSITSNRIFEQASNMYNSYPNKAYIIIIGSYRDYASSFSKGINSNAVLGAMASITTKHNIPVLTVENERQFAFLAVKLIEKHGESPDLQIIKRLNYTTESSRIVSLTAVKGVSTDKATKILEVFKTISNVCAATEDELAVVSGVGPKTAHSIKEIFN